MEEPLGGPRASRLKSIESVVEHGDDAAREEEGVPPAAVPVLRMCERLSFEGLSFQTGFKGQSLGG